MGRMHHQPSEGLRDQMPRKRGIKTKNGGMKEGKTLERHVEAETHTGRHASTHVFLLNEDQAGVGLTQGELSIGCSLAAV